MAGNPKTSKWRSTPNTQRHRKEIKLTLSPEAHAKLERLARGGHKSPVIERLILEAEEEPP